MLSALVLSGLIWSQIVSSLPTRRDHMPKILIEPKLFPIFNRYAHFTSASYTVPCRSPPYGATIVDYANVNLTSTQVTVYRDDAEQEIIMSFPGTDSFDDEVTDILALLVAPELVPLGLSGAKCPGCSVHLGVLLSYDSISLLLRSILKPQMKEYPDYKLIITGHSLGGSLATLAYASLMDQGYPISAVYTFGQPRTGNPAFANHIDSLSNTTLTQAGSFYRSTHGSDGVPQLPSQPFGYRHSMTEYWEVGPTGNSTGPEAASTTWRCFGQEASDCNDSEGNGFVLQGQGHGYYGGVIMGGGASCGS